MLGGIGDVVQSSCPCKQTRLSPYIGLGRPSFSPSPDIMPRFLSLDQADQSHDVPDIIDGYKCILDKGNKDVLSKTKEIDCCQSGGLMSILSTEHENQLHIHKYI